MENSKEKSATAGTMAAGESILFSDVQYIPLQSRDGELVGTGSIHLHPTQESALRESQARTQNL